MKPPRPCDEWFTLARDYTVLEVGEGVDAILAHTVGRNLWDVFVTARDAFEWIYEEAWTVGCTVRVTHWEGHVVKIAAARTDDGVLLVSFEYVPVEGLRDAISRADDWLREAGDDRREAGGSLTSLPVAARSRLRLVG